MSIFQHFNPFRQPTPEQIRSKQIEDAERHALEHEANAEHCAALASMYRARVERLRSLAQQHEHQAVDFKTGRRVA